MCEYQACVQTPTRCVAPSTPEITKNALCERLEAFFPYSLEYS